MRTDTRVLQKTLLAVFIGAALTGCDLDSSSDTEKSSGFDGRTADDGQAVIYYIRKDNNYDGWGLHLWNNDNCTSVEDTQNNQSIGDWANPVLPTDVDAYGAYYELDLLDSTDLVNGCINFILHKGDEKDIGGDLMLKFAEFPDRQIFLHSGNGTFFDDYVEEPPVGKEGTKAHWISKDTLVWEDGAAATTAELHYSPTASISYDAESKSISGGQKIDLFSGSLSQAQKDKFPHLADFGALEIRAEDQVLGEILKGQLVAVARDIEGDIIAVTQLQIPGVLDDLYGEAATAKQLGAVVEGSEISFGLWAPTARQVQLVAYDANKRVKPGFPAEMMFDTESGVWSHDGTGVEAFDFYRYAITVYHPTSDRMETYEVTDPYSLSLANNSTHSQVVDLNDPATKPAGWDNKQYEWTQQPEDMVIYESHIRDFSVYDARVPDADKGKYTAFSYTDSHGMRHLVDLAGAGLTHFHLLPAFDIATVDESITPVNLDSTIGDLCAVNASASVCAEEDANTVIREVMQGYVDATAGDTDKPQALMNDLRMFDSFNWGYDPFHYTVPEGSYASDAEGEQRIVEFREMVMNLHEIGLGVIMDVVYNHTNASGPTSSKSVLDKIVPGYYHRLNPETGLVETSTCCENTASEHVMMEKLMIDSLVVWTEDYGIDAFRFDLMGHHMKANMEKALAAVREVKPNTYFYGEGWNFGEVADNTRGENAIQWNMAGTEIGTFSDRMRDAVRGGGPFDGGNDLRKNQGFGNGLGVAALRNEKVIEWLDEDAEANGKALDASYANALDLIRVGMAGNLQEFLIIDKDGKVRKGKDVDYNGDDAGYALDPQEVVNYVSKHDNQTLWDNNQYKFASDISSEDRARMQVLGLSFPLLSQGIPFIHMGSEMLRSKSMQRDSYDSGDWFNAVNWDSYQGNNWNVGLPRKDKDGDNWDLIREIIQDPNAEPTRDDIENTKAGFMALMKVRQSTPLLRLQTADEIINRLDFHNTGEGALPGLIAMSIDNGVMGLDGEPSGLDSLDDNHDAIMVVINAADEQQEIAVANAAGFTLHPAMIDYAAGASFSAGKFTVPALTSAVFVKVKDGNGIGLPINQKELGDLPPFGETTVHLRGGLTESGWDAVAGNEMAYMGSGVYMKTLPQLSAGSYTFKVAGSDWGGPVNFGGGALILGEAAALSLGGDDLGITVPADGNYVVLFDYSDPSAPKLTFAADVLPFDGTAVHARGLVDAGWNTVPANQFTYIGGGRYELTLDFAEGSHKFKIGGSDWGGPVNFGSATLTFGSAASLTFGAESSDIMLKIETAGSYTLRFNAYDPKAAELAIFANN